MNHPDGDKIGPRYVLKVYNHHYQVWGFLVIDNTALGPGKGGIRMTPKVTEEEVARLARAMTYKNVLAGIPFGGAKAGLVFNPKTAERRTKDKIVAWFASELKPLLIKYYIAGPDINMAERDMAVFVRAAGKRRAATGKPRRLGGLPHELGSTGFGVALAARAALSQRRLNPELASAAIEGFGNVGQFACKFLTASGVKVTAVSDSRGVIYNPHGLKYWELLRVKTRSGSVINYLDGEKLPGGKIFELPIDILIPAALPDVINESNAGRIKAKIIVEGANIAVTPAAEAKLHERGVLVVPDIIANAGGVISSYAEDRGWSAEKMFKLVEKKISASVQTALQAAAKTGATPRAAALKIAKQKLTVRL